MVQHYFLFKHGTWYPYRDFQQDVDMFDFVGATQRHRVAILIGTLAAMLLDPGHRGKSYMRLLFLKLGGCVQTWPKRIKTTLQVSLMIAIASLWHKLFVFFEAYPWALAPAFDYSLPEAERWNVLARFMEANWC